MAAFIFRFVCIAFELNEIPKQKIIFLLPIYMRYFKLFHFEFYITHDRHPSLCSSIENVFEIKTYFVHFTTSVQNELYENMLVAQTVCKQNWFLQQGNNLLQCQHPPW